MSLATLALWFDEEPKSGPWNMAIDQALLELTHQPLLRIYTWSEPTISIGYRHSLTQDFAQPIVRRWTGGGVVQHDAEETTYSLVLPQTEPWSKRPAQQIYQAIHRALAAQLGSTYHIAETPGPAHNACFASWSQWDILRGQHKVAGAAQRRSRHGILHQGSLRVGPLAPTFWQAVAEALSPQVIPFTASAALHLHAADLVTQRYGTPDWWQPPGERLV
jgi:lipoyl(octanoyl) transferase